MSDLMIAATLPVLSRWYGFNYIAIKQNTWMAIMEMGGGGGGEGAMMMVDFVLESQDFLGFSKNA